MVDTKLLLFLLIGMLVSGPNHAAEQAAGVVNVYNWADYIGETTLAGFEEEFGIQVNYDVYDTSAIVDVKLMAGRSGYDVVIHAASNSAQLIPIGVFQQLDRSKLPNWTNLDPLLLSRVAQFDPDNLYGFPYMWGTTGFSFNRRMLQERMPDPPLDSAELVFNPEVVAHFADCGVTLLDSASEVLGMALVYLGYEANSVEREELKQAEALLSAIRPHIKYFGSSKLLLDLPSEEVCIAQSWSGDYSVASRRAAEAGIEIDLGFNIPQEGSLMWFDVAFIPADAPNARNAHLFLNYLMRPEVIAEISNYTGYANINRRATELVEESIRSDPAIYPDDNVLRRMSVTTTLPPKIERRRSRAWTRIKSGL
ncbi:MAG: polyamine ABC transporter substrate-binding protein [Pseudomonadota bacterium]